MWQAALAFGVAVIGFLGVVIGAVVTGFVTLRQTQLVAQREREARQVEQAQARKDAHDAFQRDAIIALHDAISDYWLLAIEVHEQVWLATHPPPERVDFRPILRPMRPASSRVTAARAKVFDDELRRLVKEFGQLERAVTKWDQEGEEAWSACRELRGQIDERVNALLRHLF